jgi:hypothetical protein
VKNDVGLRTVMILAVAHFVLNGALQLSEENKALYKVLYKIVNESYTLLEFIAFISFLYLQVQNKTVRKLMKASIICFTTFFFIYTFLIKPTDLFDSTLVGVESIIILSFAYYYLYERMKETTTMFIYNTPHFWVVLGMVLYLGGCFFIYVFTSSMGKDSKIVEDYWFITNIFSILKNILFCVAIRIQAKPPDENFKYDLDLSRLN